MGVGFEYLNSKLLGHMFLIEKKNSQTLEIGHFYIPSS